MKKYLIPAAIVLLLIESCRKHSTDFKKEDFFTQQVMAAVKDSMQPADYSALDFSKAIKTRTDASIIMRVPFKGKAIRNDFLLLRTDDPISSIEGRLIHIEGVINTHHQYNGLISISSLQNKTILQSDIKNGFVTGFDKPGVLTREESMEDPYVEMPGVIIVSNYSSSGISYAEWYSLTSFLDGGYSQGYYSIADPASSSYGGGGGGGGSTGGGTSEQLLQLEPEYIYGLAGVDISKYFECFYNIPSDGAAYSIKLCTDVPSNNSPGSSANFSAVSAGHTFLTITKENDGQKVVQSFGFYPGTELSLWDPFKTVPSEMKDNGAQEINASIEMSITSQQFEVVKYMAIALANHQYELADYNCSDYAVDVFNSVRENPLKIPLYKIFLPGNSNPWSPTEPNDVIINRSPQMLFQTMQRMKDSNGSEAANIRIDLSHNYRAPISNGECH